MRRLALAVGLAACRGEATPPVVPIKETPTVMPTAAPSSATDPRIEENTVAELSGRKVTLGNVWSRTYRTAAGGEATGPAGVIGVSDGARVEETVAGLGSQIPIGGDRYEVIAIDVGDVATDRPGEVRLRLIK